MSKPARGSSAIPAPVAPADAVQPAPKAALRPRPPVVRYLGFEITAEGREYSLLVTSDLPPRSFVLLVTHQAFASRLTRFQDAPDLCFRRLARELARDPALAPGDRLCFTTDDLLDYQSANAPGAAKRKRPASAVPAP